MTADVPREWLEADGLGGFASGTVSGVRTRRYHALLLAATTPPSGRMVLVNGLDAVLEIDGASFPISRQRYLPNVDAPPNPAPLTEFVPEPWPRWRWKLGDGELVQELFAPHESPTVVLRWHWSGLARVMRLRVTPFLSGRDFHALHHQNDAFNFIPVVARDRQRWTPYPGVPSIIARSNGAYTQDARWYLNFLYDEERARGMDYAEDLAAPGRYDFDLATGPAVLIFSTADLDRTVAAADLAEQFAESERARRAVFPAPHLRSADAYLVQRGAGRTIIAGYPWFGDWGRDTFISLRGFCLATGRLDEARGILTAWSSYVSQGMLPNRFPDVGDGAEYNSVDASLWYCIAVYEYLHAAGEDWSRCAPATA